jgi:plasmid stabilization system protein ParE
MHIRWTNAAAADMQSISDYLKDNHPHYRQPTMRKLYQRIRALKDGPMSAGPRIEGGTCETLSPPMPYVAVYRLRENRKVVCTYDTSASTVGEHINYLSAVAVF